MPASSPPSILLIGCGKMGFALVKGWLRGMDGTRITLVDPNPNPELLALAAGMRHYALPADVPSDLRFTVVMLAVKPQSMDMALGEIPAAIRKQSPLYISVAAGRTLGYFTDRLGEHAAVIRAMPNTPALIGRGITVLCANAGVNHAQKHEAASLLKAVGSVVWLQDESKMDAVTALSGSGPAYVFYFLDALVGAAVKLGLDSDMARQLAIETLGGSAALAEQSGRPFEQLRRDVTSPGGTTEAALTILTQRDVFTSLIDETLAAAAKRAKELS